MTRRRPWAHSVAEPSDRYVLHLLGQDVLDVVSMIGGLIFDRALSGWDVTAFAPELTATRPLDILGCRAQRLESACLTIEPVANPTVLGVSAVLYSEDATVRDMVRASVERGSSVVIWGEDCTDELDCTSAALYVLGRAATVFKAHALRAAGAPGAWPNQVEEFRVITPLGTRSGWGPARAPVLRQVSSLGGMQ